MKDLLKKGATTVNFGMESFFEDLKAQKAVVTQVEWKPSAASSDLLAKLKRLKKGGE